MKTRKMLWLLPLMMALIAVSSLAAFDISWTCPQSGSSAGTVVRDNAKFTDDGPYDKCMSSGNNLTIEFTVTGDSGDWMPISAGGDLDTSGNTTTSMNATLYIYRDSNLVYSTVLATNFTNSSTTVTESDLLRFTDFGKLSEGKPAWVGNLTEGSYKFYVILYNSTDDSTGEQLLSSEKGMDSSDPVRFTLDEENAGVAWDVVVENDMLGAEQTKEIQSALGINMSKQQQNGLLVFLLIVVAAVFLSGKGKGR